jgi:hypothetical protein
MRSLFALITVTLLALPASVEAQKVTAGKWTGTITPPNGGAVNATFDVRQSGDTTKITMNADGRTIETSDVKIEATRLLFTFIPGNETVQCTLLLQSDKQSYSGDCIDSRGGKGTIAMTPPKA